MIASDDYFFVGEGYLLRYKSDLDFIQSILGNESSLLSFAQFSESIVSL